MRPFHVSFVLPVEVKGGRRVMLTLTCCLLAGASVYFGGHVVCGVGEVVVVAGAAAGLVQGRVVGLVVVVAGAVRLLGPGASGRRLRRCRVPGGPRPRALPALGFLSDPVTDGLQVPVVVSRGLPVGQGVVSGQNAGEPVDVRTAGVGTIAGRAKESQVIWRI